MPRSFTITHNVSEKFILNIENLKLDSRVHFLVGPNGSGKSSLLQQLNLELNKTNEKSIYMPPSSEAVDDLRLFEILNIFEIGLPAELSRFRDSLDISLNSLSSGQKQRFLLYTYSAVSSYNHILLDEPTNFLDPKYKSELLNYIHKSTKNFTIATHDLNWLIQFPNSSASLLLDGKNIHQGPTKALVESLEMKKAFQMSFQVEDNDSNEFTSLRIKK